MLLSLLLVLGLYPKSAKVTMVNPTTDTVTVTDCNGFMWDFKGTEDWEVGDNVAIIMSGNGTETIYDDEIITVRYEAKGE